MKVMQPKPVPSPGKCRGKEKDGPPAKVEPSLKNNTAQQGATFNYNKKLLAGQQKQGGIKKMTNLSILNLKVVKEKEVEYEGLEMRVTQPEIIFNIAINGLQVHQQTIESFYTFTLDTKNKVTGIFEVSRGTLNASIVHPRDVFQRAILQNANSIILMHNHPSGDPAPSQEDINTTNRLQEAGEIIGIKVLDHIIVGDENNYISFKERHLM